MMPRAGEVKLPPCRSGSTPFVVSRLAAAVIVAFFIVGIGSNICYP